jgi:hypothetical protein
MLFKEIIAIYSENHTKPKIHSVGRMQSFISQEVPCIISLLFFSLQMGLIYRTVAYVKCALQKLFENA